MNDHARARPGRQVRQVTMHHVPNRGGASESQRHLRNYAHTLQVYAPPPDYLACARAALAAPARSGAAAALAHPQAVLVARVRPAQARAGVQKQRGLWRLMLRAAAAPWRPARPAAPGACAA